MLVEPVGLAPTADVARHRRTPVLPPGAWRGAVARGRDDRAAPPTHDIVRAGIFACDHAVRGMRVIDARVPRRRS